MCVWSSRYAPFDTQCQRVCVWLLESHKLACSAQIGQHDLHNILVVKRFARLTTVLYGLLCCTVYLIHFGWGCWGEGRSQTQQPSRVNVLTCALSLRVQHRNSFVSSVALQTCARALYGNLYTFMLKSWSPWACIHIYAHAVIVTSIHQFGDNKRSLFRTYHTKYNGRI